MPNEKTYIKEPMDHDLQKPDSLKKKVVQGGLWVFSLRITNKGLGVIRTIILARLLSPSDFGILGIALLAASTLETFSQTGFQAALIQKKDHIESYLDTAWVVSAVRGLLLFLILLFSAPLVAAFFNSPQATMVIKVIAVSTLLSGFRNIGIIFFQKDLEFNKQFIYELSATLVDLTIAIILAFILRNVWALVWGGLAANFVRLCMSYILHPYRPHVRFDKGVFMQLFGFGKWVLCSTILVFLVTQGDDIFVGRMLGVTALGLYQMAYLISNLPATEISHVISQVTFPAYSKLQNSLQEIRNAYLNVLQLVAFVSAPLSAGLFILSEPLVGTILGNKWIGCVPIVQVLAIAGLVRSLQATTGAIFLAVNRPEIEPKWQSIRLLTLAFLIYPLFIVWGLLGVAISVIVSAIISTLGFVYMVLKITECSIKSFIKIISIPFLNSLLMLATIWFLKKNLIAIGMWEIITLVCTGIITYYCMTYIFDKIIDYGMFALITKCLDAFHIRKINKKNLE